MAWMTKAALRAFVNEVIGTELDRRLTPEYLASLENLRRNLETLSDHVIDARGQDEQQNAAIADLQRRVSRLEERQ